MRKVVGGGEQPPAEGPVGEQIGAAIRDGITLGFSRALASRLSAATMSDGPWLLLRDGTVFDVTPVVEPDRPKGPLHPKRGVDQDHTKGPRA